MGVLTDRRVIGADWQFVKEEFTIASMSFSTQERVRAGTLAGFMAIGVLPKTIYQLLRGRASDLAQWYFISNKGVDNAPTKHKH